MVAIKRMCSGEFGMFLNSRAKDGMNRQIKIAVQEGQFRLRHQEMLTVVD